MASTPLSGEGRESGLGVASSSAWIARPRLAHRIETALDAGSVMLVAGAGAGKTTAVQQALHGRPASIAWMRCELADRDARWLIGRLVRAFRPVLGEALDVLALRIGSADDDSANRMLRDELDLLLSEPVVLVIDDAEQLAESRPAVGVLDALLRADVPQLRAIVLTRRPLDMPLVGARATGRITEFDADDLAFTPEEIAELMTARGLTAPEQVDEVARVTEGWPLGVALLATGRGSAIAVGPGDHEALFAFLAEEVVDDLPPESRAHVLRSSLPFELSQELLAALGLPDDLPEDALRRGLPLREASPGRYRWHPLFLAFARDRARAELTTEQWRGDHAVIADVIEREGPNIAAVEHLLEARECARALKTLAVSGMGLHRPPAAQVHGWLDRLPPPLRESPGASMVAGMLALAEGDQDGSLAPLQKAAEGFGAHGDAQRQWAARWGQLPALFSSARHEEIVAMADDFDAPGAPTTGGAGPVVAINACEILAFTNRREEEQRLLERVRRHPGAADVQTLIARHLALTDYQAGRIEPALDRLEQAVSRPDQVDMRPVAQALIARGWILTDIGDDAAAARAWDSLRDHAREHGVRLFASVSELYAAIIHARAGRVAEAETSLSRAGVVGGLFQLAAATAEALGAARDHQRERVVEIVHREFLDRPVVHPNRHAALTCLVLTGVHDVGAAADAARLLDFALAGWDAGHPGVHGRFYRARLLTLRAWLRYETGLRDEAMRDLAVAWDEGRECRAHVLRPDVERLEPLIATALECGALDIDQVLPVLQRAAPGGHAVLSLTEHPTARVREATLAALLEGNHPDVLRQLDDLVGHPQAAVTAAALAARDRLRAAKPPMRFSVLGGFGLDRGGWPIPDSAWRRPVAARLVRLLLAHRQAPVPEEQLFSAFWPGKPAETARRSLQVALSEARGVIDLPGADTSAIEVADRSYRLRLGPADEVDADMFLAAARGDHEEALTRFAGEPLPEDRYAPWAQEWRALLLGRYADVLRALTEQRAAAGDHRGAIETASRAVELEPLDEAAHRALMQAYASAGQIAQAVRQFLVCRRALVDGLGVEPAPETRRLYSMIIERRIA